MSAGVTPQQAAADQPAARRRGFLPPAVAAGALDAAVLLAMLTAATVRRHEPAYPGTSVVILTVAAWLPLLVRTKWPLAALAAATAVECLHLALLPYTGPHTAAGAMGAYQPVPIATAVAAWTVASRRHWPTGWIAGGTAAGLLLAASVIFQPGYLFAVDMVMFDVVILATAAGVLVSLRRERIARRDREFREETSRQVAAERLRIARDLHDAVAHHLTLVNAQASVAEYLIRADPKAAAALSGITEHSRQALDELRATVGLLRSDGESPEAGAAHSTPGVAKLGELADGFRAAGMDVSVSVTGTTAELPPGGDLAVYRIVQESLTNAAKHAPGAPAAVSLTWLDGRLDLAVTNERAPGGDPGHRGPGTGHGIMGMRERARACGGVLTARPAPGGGFCVLAAIPVKGGSA
jgi:signal transduction histidine kinase